MDNKLYLASGSLNINPNIPISLCNGRDVDTVADKIDQPLEINAMVLRQDHKRVIIISCDLFLLSDPMRNLLLDKLEKQFGIGPESVLLAATHTHSAPLTDPSRPSLGRTDAHYHRSLFDKLYNLLCNLLNQTGRPVTLHYGAQLCSQAINSRKFIRRLSSWLAPEIATLPNPAGARDDMLRTLVARDSMGEIAAVIWSYACQPTACPNPRSISSDYPGSLRRMLRDRLGQADLPVLFLNGFSANVRPMVAVDKSNPRPGFGHLNSAQYIHWTDQLYTHLLCALRQADGPPLTGWLDCLSAAIPLSEIFDGHARGQMLHMSRLTLAENFHLIGVSADVAVEYAPMLQATFPAAHVMPASCAGGVLGCLPNDAMVREGGFESEGFARLYNLHGNFRNAIEKRVGHLFNKLTTIPAPSEDEPQTPTPPELVIDPFRLGTAAPQTTTDR